MGGGGCWRGNAVGSGACAVGMGSFACGVGSGAAGRGVCTGMGAGVAFGGWGVGRTAAGVGAGTEGAGVGTGAGCTTPLGDKAVLGRYTHANVAPRMTSGRPINNAMNGTTRRLSSSVVTSAMGAAVAGAGRYGAGGGWIAGRAAVAAAWNCDEPAPPFDILC